MNIAYGLSKLGGFAVSTVLSAVAGVVFVPAVIHSHGLSAWADVAFGQGLGILGAVVLGWGWLVTGFVSIARVDLGQAAETYIDSVLSRFIVGVPVIVTGIVVIALFFRSDFTNVRILSFLVTTLGGFSASWYFVGRNLPGRYLLWETLPRVGFTFVSIVVLQMGAGLNLALEMQALGYILALALSSWSILWPVRTNLKFSFESSLRAIGAQRSGLATGLSQSIFAAFPVVLVGVFCASALPIYSLIDKLVRQAIALYTPIVQVAQGWVPHGGDAWEVKRRAERSIYFGILGAVIIFLGFLATGQTVIKVLSADRGRLSVSEIVISAYLFGVLFGERMIGRVALAGVGGESELAWSSLIGALGGLLLVVPLTNLWGPSGAVSAIGVGISFMAILQTASFFRLRQVNLP